MADLQLALNHCLTTRAASAAADTNPRLWPGLQLCNRQEAWSLSINHSFTTPMDNSFHCQTKWFLIRMDAVCFHNLFTHCCGLEIYFSQLVYVGVHMSSFQLCSLLLPHVAKAAPHPQKNLKSWHTCHIWPPLCALTTWDCSNHFNFYVLIIINSLFINPSKNQSEIM